MPPETDVTQRIDFRPAGALIAATEQTRAFIRRTYTGLGTDGFDPSDTRASLHRHFEVDRYYIVHADIDAMAKDGKMTAKDTTRAIKLYKRDQDKPDLLGV
ncbi:hypothetical protein E2F46_15305 [Luteimonas aestuarii]|uniref:Uncharacterized protein n=1 Tax=Luteimonas aestuarii TaxID=453837 RepID=A0A4V3AM33_9GAMM|nr:hypothetical protein E2F46_15305 [Luteimonas aestuarii]